MLAVQSPGGGGDFLVLFRDVRACVSSRERRKRLKQGEREALFTFLSFILFITEFVKIVWWLDQFRQEFFLTVLLDINHVFSV